PLEFFTFTLFVDAKAPLAVQVSPFGGINAERKEAPKQAQGEYANASEDVREGLNHEASGRWHESQNVNAIIITQLPSRNASKCVFLRFLLRYLDQFRQYITQRRVASLT